MRIIKCNECGSESIKKAGRNVWRVADREKHIRQRVQKMQCNNCGKIFTVEGDYERIFVVKNGGAKGNVNNDGGK